MLSFDFDFMSFSFLSLALLLGCRHGVDPDHLAAIDGLARIRNSPWNGVLFALGHGLFVTLLAAGVGMLSISWLEQLSPWFLIAIGSINLFRLVRTTSSHRHYSVPSSSPFILGIIFAAGFETASQLSTLALAHQVNAWCLGATFGLGMLIVDGIDGYNASLVQTRIGAASFRGQRASRYLSVLVIFTSYALAITELCRVNLREFALPLGILLFGTVFALRLWSRMDARSA